MIDASLATSGPNYTSAHLGPLEELQQYQFEHPVRKVPVVGKAFLNELLGATGSQISLTKLPPNASVPFFHSHKLNEEIFIVVQGDGEMQIDDDVIPIHEGSVIRVATPGERCLRNTSSSASLIYICVQAKAGSLETHTFTDGVTSTRTWKVPATTPS